MDPTFPAVAVHGKKCDFGDCIHELLLQNQAKAEEKNAEVSVIAEWKYPWLNLIRADPGGTGTAFQHAAHCPAREFASPDRDGYVRVGIATVLERNMKVLITKRNAQLRSFPNTWVVPGGHIEPNETLVETARREIFEETGLRESIYCFDELLGVWESCFPHRAALGRMTHHHAVCYVHAVATGSEELHLQTSEVQSIAWLTRDEVAAILNLDETVKIDVFHAETSSVFMHPGAVAADTWHGQRALVSKEADKTSARAIYESMTAGTRWALHLWLEKSKSSI